MTAEPSSADATAATAATAPTVWWPSFRWFWSGYAVSILGDQVTMLALPYATFSRTGSPFAVGIVAGIGSVTMVVLGLFAGAAADRLRHREVMVATDLARFGVLGVVALVTVDDGFPVASLYVASFLLALLRVLHDAAAGAALPLVVPAPSLLLANSRLQGSEALGNALGPPLAGVLIGAGSLALAFAADAITFLVSAIAVAQVGALRTARRAVAWTGWSRLRADVAEGIRVIRADRPYVHAVSLIAGMNIIAIAVEAHFVPYAREELHLGAFGTAMFFAVGGVAGVATAAVVGRAEQVRGDRMLQGVWVFALGVLLAGLVPNRLTAGLAFACAGFGHVLATTHFYAMRQRRFPLELLGRVVMTTRIVLFGVMPVGFVAGGALASATSPSVLFVAAACCGLVAVAYSLSRGLGRLRLG